MLVMRIVGTSERREKRSRKTTKRKAGTYHLAMRYYVYAEFCSSHIRCECAVSVNATLCGFCSPHIRVQWVWTDDKEVKRCSYSRVITHIAHPAAFFFDLTFWATTSGSCESSSGIIPKPVEGLASGIFTAGSSSTESEPSSSASFGSST